MKFKLCLQLGLIALLPSCSAPSAVTDDFCLNFQPIFVSRDDRLTDETAKPILADDRLWQERCKG